MVTLTIILERHTETTSADYLKKPENRQYVQDAILGLECCKDRYDIDEIGPISQKEMIESRDNPTGNGKSASCHALFPSLVGHEHCYNIDSVFGTDMSREIWLQIGEQFANIGSGGEQVNNVIMWSRDQYMAVSLIALLNRYKYHKPKKNIIIVVGAHHFAILYHFLYFLLPEFANTKIRVLDLENDAEQHPTLVSFSRKLPVPTWRAPRDAFHLIPSLQQLSMLPAVIIQSIRLEAFKHRYRTIQSQYSEIQTFLKDMCERLNQVVSLGSPPEKPVANQIAVNKFFEQYWPETLQKFSDFKIPDYSHNLIGSELFFNAPIWKIKMYP